MRLVCFSASCAALARQRPSPFPFFSAGTKENGVINYLVSAALRRESAPINSYCLSFSAEERTDARHPRTHTVWPPEKGCRKDPSLRKILILNPASRPDERSDCFVPFSNERTLNATFSFSFDSVFDNNYRFASDFL